MIFFYKINLCCALFAAPLIRNCLLEYALQYMHTLFVHDEEIQGYSLRPYLFICQ